MPDERSLREHEDCREHERRGRWLRRGADRTRCAEAAAESRQYDREVVDIDRPAAGELPIVPSHLPRPARDRRLAEMRKTIVKSLMSTLPSAFASPGIRRFKNVIGVSIGCGAQELR